MELLWNEVSAERLVKTVNTQLRVTGVLPSPDGNDIIEVTGTKASVKVDEAEVLKDQIRITGKVVAVVNVRDENGKPFSYESYAGFENTIEAEGAVPGMRAAVSTSIQSIASLPDGKGANMSAVVDVCILIVSETPLRVIGGVSGISDLEMRKQKLVLTKKRPIGSSVLRLREEIAAEDVKEVISSEGQIAVRDVSLEQGGASVSGMITVTAVTGSSKGHIAQFTRQIPFRERVEINGIGNEAFCTSRIESLYMRSLGEDLALISLETEVSFEIFCIDEYEAEIPTDAFSPGIGFDCLFEKERFLSCRGAASAQSTIRESLTLPNSSSDNKEALFANAYPVVTETVTHDGTVDVSGVFVTGVTYESISGIINTFSEDVPFSASLEVPQGTDLPIVSAGCTASIASGSERSVQIQYNLLLNADAYGIDEQNAVVGLAESEKRTSESGIVICFASEGEDVFDIAKRCGVPCSEVRDLNPDAEEPFREGDRLLVMV